MSTAADPHMIETVQVVKNYCDAWMAGDVMTVLSLYHDDLTLIWPGRHSFAGTHAGQRASIEALAGLQSRTNRRPIEIIDVLIGASSVMAIVVERWTRPDDESFTMDITRGLEWTIENAKLRTCRLFETDQPAIDDWLGRSEQPMPVHP